MSTHALARRVAIVTGASAGIGKEIARGLAVQGATVILACRSAERGAAAVADIEASITKAGAPGRASVITVDLASQASIRAFAEQVHARHPELHVLVNNAGIWADKRELSPDGIEVTWATNVLAYHLLARLFEARLVRSAPARIINVVSTMASGLDVTDPGFERRGFGGIKAYSQSKQANRMLTWSMAERLASTKVTVNAAHPGAVATSIAAAHSVFARMFFKVMGRTPAEGADTMVWLATAPELESVTGTLWKNRRQVSCKFRGESARRALWELVERQTGLTGAGAGAARIEPVESDNP